MGSRDDRFLRGIGNYREHPHPTGEGGRRQDVYDDCTALAMSNDVLVRCDVLPMGWNTFLFYYIRDMPSGYSNDKNRFM